MVTFDSTLPGTQATEWETAERFADLAEFDWSGIRSVVVIAAHPDDETLGAGGLIAECVRHGIPTKVVVVTDGSGSHPRSTVMPPDELARVRDRELRLAIIELAPEVEVVTLGFQDGQTERSRASITASLGEHLVPGATVVAPWRGDGHSDHRVVGEICAELSGHGDRPFLEYPIWMWHWAAPDDERVPWELSVALTLSGSARESKRRALAAYHSQVVGIGPAVDDGPVLLPDFLANFDRDREVFIVTKRGHAGPKSEAYFDNLYAQNSDPWRLSTRWYEERKRAITVASLPRERYSSALEIGCSVGELTATIAPRADHLLALDISAAAVEAASARTAGMRGVEVEQRDATTDFPTGPFDLVVLSEVGYYWDRQTLIRVLGELTRQLTVDGTIVACHWRHPVADYPLRGDDVMAILRSTLGMPCVATHDEADFLLEVFASTPESVAQREGLVP